MSQFFRYASLPILVHKVGLTFWLAPLCPLFCCPPLPACVHTPPFRCWCSSDVSPRPKQAARLEERHTFSAFRPRSSVVSVLISLISDISPSGEKKLVQFLVWVDLGVTSRSARRRCCVWPVCACCCGAERARRKAQENNSPAPTKHTRGIKVDTFSSCACHPCAGTMLIFSVSFQF